MEFSPFPFVFADRLPSSAVFAVGARLPWLGLGGLLGVTWLDSSTPPITVDIRLYTRNDLQISLSLIKTFPWLTNCTVQDLPWADIRLNAAVTAGQKLVLVTTHSQSHPSTILLALPTPTGPQSSVNMPYYHIYQLKLSCDRQSVGQSVSVLGFHLEHMPILTFSVWQLRVSWCGVPSLKRGWVCNVLAELLLGLARAITLGSKSCRSHAHFTVLFEGPQTCRARTPYLHPPETGWPSYTLDTGLSYLL
jgi:hypothetical protein